MHLAYMKLTEHRFLGESFRACRRLRISAARQTCVSCNCDINSHIKFIFNTAIDDLEWKKPIDLGHFVNI